MPAITVTKKMRALLHMNKFASVLDNILLQFNIEKTADTVNTEGLEGAFEKGTEEIYSDAYKLMDVMEAMIDIIQDYSNIFKEDDRTEKWISSMINGAEELEKAIGVMEINEEEAVRAIKNKIPKIMRTIDSAGKQMEENWKEYEPIIKMYKQYTDLVTNPLSKVRSEFSERYDYDRRQNPERREDPKRRGRGRRKEDTLGEFLHDESASNTKSLEDLESESYDKARIDRVKNNPLMNANYNKDKDPDDPGSKQSNTLTGIIRGSFR